MNCEDSQRVSFLRPYEPVILTRRDSRPWFLSQQPAVASRLSQRPARLLPVPAAVLAPIPSLSSDVASGASELPGVLQSGSGQSGLRHARLSAALDAKAGCSCAAGADLLCRGEGPPRASISRVVPSSAAGITRALIPLTVQPVLEMFPDLPPMLPLYGGWCGAGALGPGTMIPNLVCPWFFRTPWVAPVGRISPAPLVWRLDRAATMQMPPLAAAVSAAVVVYRPRRAVAAVLRSPRPYH